MATLLTLKLRQEYPGAVCWAFSPPGALMSPPLADDVKRWCTSVVLGKDLVPRLSVPALYRLSRQMVRHWELAVAADVHVVVHTLRRVACCVAQLVNIARARVPKHKVLRSWLCCFRRPPQDKLMFSPGHTPQSRGAADILRYRACGYTRPNVGGCGWGVTKLTWRGCGQVPSRGRSGWRPTTVWQSRPRAARSHPSPGEARHQAPCVLPLAASSVVL